MPSAGNLAPNIPNHIFLNHDDADIQIDFILGYDTVSCNCGNADCFTQCNSDTDIIVKFTDNLTG